MFVLELALYACFAWVMCFFAKHSAQISIIRNNTRWDKYLSWYVAFFVLLGAIHYGVGADSVTYAYIFKYGLPANIIEARSNEVLWVAFVNCLRSWELPFIVGMGLCAFFQLYPITLALKEYRELLIVLPIVLFAGWVFPSWMNAVRQFIVGCGFVYASRWIVEKKFWHYIIFLWLAHYIHNSALILIPLYFIVNRFSLADKRWLGICIFFGCFIIGLTPQFGVLAQYISGLAEFIGYEDYSAIAMEKLINTDVQEARVFGITMFSYALTCLFPIYYAPDLKTHYSKQIPYFNVWYNLGFIYACGFFLFSNVSHILMRPFLHMANFLMIIDAILLCYFKNGIKSSFLFGLTGKQMFYLFIFFMWMGLAWSLYKVTGTPGEMLTFKFIWNYEI